MRWLFPVIAALLVLDRVAWLDRFLALLPSRASGLDLGCGSGRPIARTLIERGCQVTGVDAVPAMIILCEQAFPSAD
jgi:SAM-dependent methyltransferase